MVAKKGLSELQAQVRKVKSGQKAIEKKNANDNLSEFERALQKRTQKMQAEAEEQAREAALPELQRKFTVLKKKTVVE